ncbi:TonB-dependent siderophore receptor [Iningainema sp. BLCCT55]|uniref:TonB-dependent siderophore receptor n=2 Tax=Iningainema TaxID=1932705 RepID=A0A8J6XH26_9CYAN|nr:TonB-dependent siderophore receptor [Iningainema tapete BLCC-T55]
MRIQRLLSSICLWLGMSFLPLLIAQSVQAQVKENDQAAITRIPRLSEVKLPATNVNGLLSQSPTPQATPASGIVPITSVKANPTDKGVEIILETTQGTPLQVTNRSTGNSFITDVSGGQLRLPDGNAFTFRSEKPIEGITEISVTNINANTVQVTVVGEKALPTVELYDDDGGLIFAVASQATATQPQAPQAQEKPALPPQEEPSAQQDEPIELVVTGEQDSYRLPDATTATKTDTPLRDIPQSIQVIPRQIIQDQNITRVGEAIRNVSGVQRSSASAGSFDIFVIRGFSSGREGILRNGLRDRSNTGTPSETANFERIEVLKGPSAALYGQGGLGGTINYVTKKPLRDPFYAVEGMIGNFDFYRGAIDLSGPLNGDNTLSYRLNVAAETSGSFIDLLETQRYFVAPVLTWQIGKNTTLTFEAEYLNSQESGGNLGLPAEGTVRSNPNGKIPLNRSTVEPYSKNNRYTYRVGYNFEHRFSDNWQVRNAFRATWVDVFSTFVLPIALSPDQRRVERILSNYPDSLPERYYALDTYVVGKFNTGSVQHQLLTGVDLFRSFQPSYEGFDREVPDLDLFNPVYSRSPGAVLSSFRSSDTTRDALGIYIQDQITLADNLKVLLGGRFDILSEKQEPSNAETTFQQNEGFSPRVGIVYQPVPAISLYANYSRAITQVVGTTFDRRLFEPERGTQYEVGVKADLSSRLSAILAFYEITKSNVRTNDPSNPLFSIQTGEQRSRGIEFDITGEILPGWNLIAAAAYTDARITADNTFAVGNRINNVAEFTASLWTTYELQEGPAKGLGVGVGLYYVGDRQGDLANSFTLPSYFRTDAAIFYKRGQFRAGINFKNLFDINYFESADGDVYVYPGAPFTVQGTISWQF